MRPHLALLALLVLGGCGELDPSAFCPTCTSICAGNTSTPPSYYNCPDYDCLCAAHSEQVTVRPPDAG